MDFSQNVQIKIFNLCFWLLKVVCVYTLCLCVLARWVKVTMAVGEESEEAVERQRLATDTDVLTLEQPGRVTG